MNPLLIVLIVWIGLCVPASVVFGAMAGSADRRRRRSVGDRSDSEDRVDVLAGGRDAA